MENDIQDALASIPGVTSAAFASAMPMEGFGSNLGVVNSGAIVTSDAFPHRVQSAAALVQIRIAGFLRDRGHAACWRAARSRGRKSMA